MANEIHSQQVVVFSTKVTLQSHDLAGSTREKHLATRFQKPFRLLESLTGPALYIFASPESSQTLFGFGIIMDDIPILVKPGAKHDTILRKDIFCQEGENTTRGAGTADFIIRILSGINTGCFSFPGFNQFGTDFLAFSTINATCHIYLWIQKAFLIHHKVNTLYGTT